MGHKGHYGEYSGNAKWSRDHAHTKVTKENYKASERDDAAHIDYLKRDVDYDDKHGHSDEDMTADEKHISKLAGDMKYDKEHHGSPAHIKGSYNMHKEANPEQYKRADNFYKHMETAEHHSSPAHQEKKMMKTLTRKTKCAEGYYKDSKGNCVPMKKDPEELQRKINTIVNN